VKKIGKRENKGSIEKLENTAACFFTASTSSRFFSCNPKTLQLHSHNVVLTKREKIQ
jgi:hypothetical protein